MIDWDTECALVQWELHLESEARAEKSWQHLYCVEFAQDWCLDLSEFALVPAD